MEAAEWDVGPRVQRRLVPAPRTSEVLSWVGKEDQQAHLGPRDREGGMTPWQVPREAVDFLLVGGH